MTPVEALQRAEAIVGATMSRVRVDWLCSQRKAGRSIGGLMTELREAEPALRATGERAIVEITELLLQISASEALLAGGADAAANALLAVARARGGVVHPSAGWFGPM